jgi:hypothetical protein
VFAKLHYLFRGASELLGCWKGRFWLVRSLTLLILFLFLALDSKRCKRS